LEKTDKKQVFKSREIISLFLLSISSLLVISPIIMGQFADHHEIALQRAENLAYQVLESHRGSRGPASIQEAELNHLSADQGVVGLDPWGRPYNFQFLKSVNGGPTKVVVWSKGPNGKPETAEEAIDSGRDGSEVHFNGDDIGVMVSIK
jgi:hypothetical protein